VITLKELNRFNLPTTPEIDKNLAILLERLNLIRVAYGKPLFITSGLRSQAQQSALIRSGKSTAPHSNHLVGAAVDIGDQSGDFYDWCQANESILEEAQLWCENRQGPWQHLQIFPPKSGKRWFNP